MSVKLPMQVGETRVCIFGTTGHQSTGCLFSHHWLLDNGPLVQSETGWIIEVSEKLGHQTTGMAALWRTEQYN